MLKALTLEVPEGTEGKVSFPEDLLGSALEGTLVSWAEIGYRFRSQSPLFVLAIFKNCLQINDVALKSRGRYYFRKKSLPGGIGVIGRHWKARLSRKISGCLFCGYLPWTLGRTGPGGRYAEDIAYEKAKTYRNFYFNLDILVLLAGSRHSAVCRLVNWGQTKQTLSPALTEPIFSTIYMKLNPPFFQLYSE